MEIFEPSLAKSYVLGHSFIVLNGVLLCSGCGADGRAVTSDTRDPRFESSIRKFHLLSTVSNKALEKRRK